MKKKFKKIASLVLAVVMAFAMAVPAMAAEEGAGSCKIKIKNSAEGHTYEAYQIFSGDLGTSDDGKMLGNIKWGTGVDAEKLSTLKDKLKTAGIAADSTEDAASDAYARAVAYALNDLNAKQFAQIVGEFLSTQKKTTNTSTEGVYEINGLDSGYYLVKDENGSLDSMNNEAYTEFILRVLGEEEINAKSDVPEVEKKVKEKKVKEKNDTTGITSDWQDGADYDIWDDDIEFQLTGTLPTNYSAYTTYKYVFHDTLSKGLTYNDESVKVFLVNGGTETPLENGFVISTSTVGEETQLTISFTDLKTVVPEAVAGMKIVVRYTATLNENAKFGVEGNPNRVYLEYSNNPDGTGEGKTPEDKVTVFTYKLVVKKVNEEGPLSGAEFTLYKKQPDGTYAETTIKPKKSAVEKDGASVDDAVFTWEGLDAGDYRLEETKVPAGYNKAEDIYFTISGTYGAEGNPPTLTKLVIKDSDRKEIGTSESSTGEGMTFTVDLTAGSAQTDVINVKGATLPETGGIGTTIFYVVGSVLVLAAVVLLVTKRRMNSK